MAEDRISGMFFNRYFNEQIFPILNIYIYILRWIIEVTIP